MLVTVTAYLAVETSRIVGLQYPQGQKRCSFWGHIRNVHVSFSCAVGFSPYAPGFSRANGFCLVRTGLFLMRTWLILVRTWLFLMLPPPVPPKTWLFLVLAGCTMHHNCTPSRFLEVALPAIKTRGKTNGVFSHTP